MVFLKEKDNHLNSSDLPSLFQKYFDDFIFFLTICHRVK